MKKQIRVKYIKHCSSAKLAAMYLNDQISDDEYFEEIKRRDEKTN